MSCVHFTPYDSDLYRMLCKKLPVQFLYRLGKNGEEDVGLNVNRLAEDMGMSGEGVRKWLRANWVPQRGAKKLIAASAGRLTIDDLLPFFIS